MVEGELYLLPLLDLLEHLRQHYVELIIVLDVHVGVAGQGLTQLLIIHVVQVAYTDQQDTVGPALL